MVTHVRCSRFGAERRERRGRSSSCDGRGRHGAWQGHGLRRGGPFAAGHPGESRICDPFKALELYEAISPRIALLVVDVVMTGMSGKDLAERLRLRRPELKVLYTSGYTENTVVHHGVVDAGIDFLAKPYVPEDLAVRVREVLDRDENG